MWRREGGNVDVRDDEKWMTSKIVQVNRRRRRRRTIAAAVGDSGEQAVQCGNDDNCSSQQQQTSHQNIHDQTHTKQVVYII